MEQLQKVQEPAREIPVSERYDVIVCGAGPAGVAAAIAAARQGARTCLIEMHGCLGGVWTAGNLSYILDAYGKGGFLSELVAEIKKRGAGYGPELVGTRRVGAVADVEELKLILEQMCADAGVHVRLYTRIAGAVRDGRGRLAAVLTESKSGREAWAADVFVDATGDGDLGALAGCGFDLGEPGTGRLQPMSLIMVVAGVDPAEAQPFCRNETQSRINLYEEILRSGKEPTYMQPALFHVRDDLYLLMANHEYEVSGMNAADLTCATMAARRDIYEVVDGLRSLGGIWTNLRIVSTGAQIGVREGRRIHGRYTVTLEDMLNGAEHEDAVCRATFGVDVHSLNAQESKGFSYQGKYKVIPYDIPLRALIAKDVDGLLLAGRCISGDFFAHSSYRVTGNAVAMGEGAGVLAGAAARLGLAPHEVPWPEVSRRLGGAGARP